MSKRVSREGERQNNLQEEKRRNSCTSFRFPYCITSPILSFPTHPPPYVKPDSVRCLQVGSRPLHSLGSRDIYSSIKECRFNAIASHPIPSHRGWLKKGTGAELASSGSLALQAPNLHGDSTVTRQFRLLPRAALHFF